MAVRSKNRNNVHLGKLDCALLGLCAKISIKTRRSDLNQSAERHEFLYPLGFVLKVNVPLRISQITSGRELLCAIDSDAVARKVIQRVERRGDVTSAKAQNGGAEPRPFASGPRLIVDLLPDSQTARKLSETATTASAELQRFAETVGEDAGLKLMAETLGSNQIRLTVDMGALLIKLTERLNERLDIEYAQPNYLLQPYLTSGQRPNMAPSSHDIVGPNTGRSIGILD